MNKMIYHIQSKADLDSIAISGKYFILDFYADWCGNCKKMEPFFESLHRASQFQHILFIKINGDIAEDLVDIFNIEGFPTFVIGKFNDSFISMIKKIIGGDQKAILDTLSKL
jgi:thiol-disulfide isomerase/thioredoxin